MDKSEQYIRMCEKAKEVQAQWTRDKGDWFVAQDGSVKCRPFAGDGTAVLKSGFQITKENGVIRLAKYTWLPRLDQLMDMAQIDGVNSERLIYIFYDWSKLPYDRLSRHPQKIFGSVEQSWLAFVMQIKHFKKWDSEEWISLF